jgi:ABC transporter substrate binding protein
MHRRAFARKISEIQIKGPFRIRSEVLGGGGSNSGIFKARIFRGAAPDDLPIEGPARFEFAVNLKTAKQLALTIPTSVLLRADQVIE